MLSFTIAHLSIIALRVAARRERFRARPNLRFGGLDSRSSRSSAGSAPRSPGSSSSSSSRRRAGPASAGSRSGSSSTGCTGAGSSTAAAETVRAPVLVLGPSLTVEYRTIVVPVKRTAESEEALVAAARLAAERGATVASCT